MQELDESLISRSKRKWIEVETYPREGRPPRRNICYANPGVKLGINPSSPKEAFLLYFDEIIDDAVRFSNLQARRIISVYNKNSRLRKKWKKLPVRKWIRNHRGSLSKL